MTIELNVLQTTGLAMLLFVLGRFIVNHVGFLRRCCIPAPVVGGLIFAIFHLVVHQTGLLTLTFDETLKKCVHDLVLHQCRVRGQIQGAAQGRGTGAGVPAAGHRHDHDAELCGRRLRPAVRLG